MKKWNDILIRLGAELESHKPGEYGYDRLSEEMREWAEAAFGADGPQKFLFEGLGSISLPYFKMGAISSVQLFGLDELILFAFYVHNQKYYKNTCDLGANLGLHSIVMAKLGWQVVAYEPDPIHTEIMLRNLKMNEIDDKVELLKRAIAVQEGTVEFTRVLGNTTSSHISGAKANPYGELEYFDVECDSFAGLTGLYDLIKMDVESFEAVLLESIDAEFFEGTDVILEVGSEENAQLIWGAIQRLGIHGYSQKNGWNQVSEASDLPVSYREGSLFLSSNRSFWSL